MFSIEKKEGGYVLIDENNNKIEIGTPIDLTICGISFMFERVIFHKITSDKKIRIGVPRLLGFEFEFKIDKIDNLARCV